MSITIAKEATGRMPLQHHFASNKHIVCPTTTQRLLMLL
jgi:hypothetical protein